jgi:hypothetical protein
MPTQTQQDPINGRVIHSNHHGQFTSVTLKCNGLPERPMPFSPVHRARKFSAVRGTTSARSCKETKHRVNKTNTTNEFRLADNNRPLCQGYSGEKQGATG